MRFALIVGAIVCLFCLGSALLLYIYLRESVIQDTYRRGQIIFALMDSIGAYVGNTLRPKMFSIISSMPEGDAFIVEAMSTTRIRHGVMEQLGERGSDFQYYRVTDRPRNPSNLADPFHTRMLTHFRKGAREPEWHGISRQNGNQTFYIVVPVYVKPECLKCHGDPEKAPAGLLKLYGKERGFGYQEGELMGLESVAISLTPALREIHNIAVQVFGIGLFGTLFLFIAIDGTFLKLIGHPLRRMAVLFEDIARGNIHLPQKAPVENMDEIGEMVHSFNIMALHLSEAQETLQTNAEILQSIIDGISDPLALVNPDGSPSVLNNAYQTWIAQCPPAVLEGRAESGEAASGAPQTMLGKVLATGRPVSGEWTGPDERFYFMSFYPILKEPGRVSQVVHYVRDITMQKRSENQMMQMEKLAAVGELSAGVAHEINNPLGIILCYAKLLERDLPSEHPAREDVQVIDRNAEACRQIVEGLLSFARQGATRKVKAQLGEHLTRIMGMVEKQFKKAGITLETRLDPDTPEFHFDPERINQVFMNLLMNARQAMPMGGTITVSTTYHPERRCVEAMVRDTGSGICPENLDKIFNPFFTTKQPGRGTGLGLSVSFGIIKEHGGEITVESVPGNGSTFIVRLPVDTEDERLD